MFCVNYITCTMFDLSDIMFEAASLSFFSFNISSTFLTRSAQTPRVLVNGSTDSSVTKQPISRNLKKKKKNLFILVSLLETKISPVLAI